MVIIYSAQVNNSVEYFCESVRTVSDRLSSALATTVPQAADDRYFG
ncbi:hypothetical protein WKK05_14465 [Nostoc sp. UHCC 0302]